MESLVTVIVPVYNSEKFLDLCISSILHQTYTNLQIIIINDGSTDNSLKIINSYAKYDKRIDVINQMNLGQSSARNNGLKISNGKFITFVDSDDYISPFYVQNLMSEMKESNMICMTNRVMCFDDNVNKNNKNIINYTKSYSSDEGIERIMYQNPDTEMFCKIFPANFFKSIKFPEGRIFEDYSIIYKLFDLADIVVYIDAYDYYYIQRKNSTMNGTFNEKKNSIFIIDKEINEFATNKPYFLKKSIYSKLFASFSNIYMQVQDELTIDLYWKKVVEYRNKLLFKRVKNRKVFIGIYASLLGKKLFKKIYLLRKEII
ncbi:glycosyltransferase [Enterococcus casseliflavus]|uniref:glycosyltransferase family 2 protein n=1 Tax=Enterococcus casseliflavus TaxID=37734 RepID=UPI001AD796B1|nr:glycosyltransferase [Enterococcus casseliflavus]MBO6383968.1 glycosyltransferase [Enterococcus casseliflavus]